MSDVAEKLTPQEEMERDALDGAFREVFNTAAGKRVLYWVLEQCSIYTEAFSADNNVTNYTLGKQAAGRVLLAKLDELDPTIYPRLLLDIAELKAMDMAAAALAAQQGEDEDEDAP